MNLDQKSIINLDELIERYKRDLYINSYKDILVNSMVDSIISDSEIDEYYDKNLNKFKLNEDLIKFRFVKIPLDNININKFRNGLIRFSSFDKNLIDSLSFQLASYNLNDSLWITKRDFFNQVDFINYENEKKYVKKDFFSVFIGCIFFVWLSQTLAINGKQFAIIVMGLILVISTRFFPDGIILMLKNKLIKKVKWLQS